MQNKAGKFSGKAHDYAAYRPDYPGALVDHLMAVATLHPESVVADVGAGTGIFTEQLLERGVAVCAVEPDSEMRRRAEERLTDRNGFSAHPEQAEATALASESCDLVVAAQAFHWFDVPRFRVECRRILKPGAPAALVWNHRDSASPLVAALAKVCRRHCEGFKNFTGDDAMLAGRMKAFFRDGVFHEKSFPHPVAVTKTQFIGRAFSSSYAPARKTTAGDGFEQALDTLFDKHAREDGTLVVPYIAVCYWGLV